MRNEGDTGEGMREKEARSQKGFYFILLPYFKRERERDYLERGRGVGKRIQSRVAHRQQRA